MGFLDKLKKPKMVHSHIYGDFPAFVSEDKLPDDLPTLRKMGMYYMSKYNHEDRDYHKSFLINSKLVRLDRDGKFMEARKSLGQLYVQGEGVQKDTAKGYALMNEWYAHQILHESSIHALGLSVNSSLSQGTMDLKQMLSLSYQRLQGDQEAYAEPVGMALFAHLYSFWEHRDIQEQEQLSNMDYFQYLYRAYQNPYALYHLACCEQGEKEDARMYTAAEGGCLFAMAYITDLKLSHLDTSEALQERTLWNHKKGELLRQLQEKVDQIYGADLETLLK